MSDKPAAALSARPDAEEGWCVGPLCRSSQSYRPGQGGEESCVACGSVVQVSDLCLSVFVLGYARSVGGGGGRVYRGCVDVCASHKGWTRIKGASTRSYFCTTLSSYKSTCTTYFYIVLVLLYDAKKIFVQTVVHSTLLVSCTKFSVRMTFLWKDESLCKI